MYLKHLEQGKTTAETRDSAREGRITISVLLSNGRRWCLTSYMREVKLWELFPPYKPLNGGNEIQLAKNYEPFKQWAGISNGDGATELFGIIIKITNNFKWIQKQDSPLAKMFFFYFICRDFHLFSFVKIPKMDRLVSFVYRCPSVLDSFSLRQYRGVSCR